MWMAPLGLVQAAAPLQVPVDRIAVAQIVMAAGMVLITLVVLGIGITTFLLYRAVRKLLTSLEKTVETLTPRAQPILSSVEKVAHDATDVSAMVKTKAQEVVDTVDELNHRIRELRAEAEARVRKLGVVLDVVQAEGEELLLDAAATARGVHTTAEALRGRAPRGLPEARRPL